MDLPVMPPVAPMLAKSADDLPVGDYLYEPKWDGFRCIVFRDGEDVVLGSRNERPLTRYFPEVVEAVRANLPPRCVVDGELVTIDGDRLSFDMLTNRIHPADSRVRMLAEQTPASFVAFDLLALGDEALLDTPFAVRRARLADALAAARPPVHLTRATGDLALARAWFAEFEGAGLDGIVAKSRDLPYRPDQRIMVKVKHERTADCVVGGYRAHKSGPDAVGSLLLGLYDDEGRLHNAGVAASFPMARRRSLLAELEPYRLTAQDEASHPWMWAGDFQRVPGGQPSRWNAGKDLSFVPLRPELVVEVAYDHMEGDRFRHTAQFRRWRPDREPTSCSYAQLDRPVRYDLADVLGPAHPDRIADG